MGFTTFGLHDHVMQGIAATGYTGPTPIQTLAIPPALEGKDVIGCAQTGTGKTAAFVLPILHRLAKSGPSGDAKRGARALILAPTRELAQQVQDAANGYGKSLSICTVAIVGGADMSKQVALLRRGADIVVATPGRLLDHLQRGTIDLSLVQVLVLDEADRMLDMGFIHDVRKIIGAVPKDRQTMFFSATVSPDVNDLARGILKNPVSVDAGGRTNPAETIVQHFYEAPQGGKFDLLIHSLESEKMESVLVFSRTKHGADKICRRLERQGIAAAALHSNRSQPQRERALEGFKQGRFRVLVATDIAARGIDVSGISHVINFDIPQFPEDYIHRIGRTGRAGASGDAVTFVGSDDQQYLRRIEKYTGKRFTVKKYPGGVPALPGPASVPDSAPRRTPHAKVVLSPQRPKPVQGGSPMGVPFRQRPARVKKQTILATRKRKGSTGKLDSFSSDRDGSAWSNY
jgi:ATP-dependent RNA helicase RhlE